jgi:predicted HD superfamily hydrolase involved in NAD metabolism
MHNTEELLRAALLKVPAGLAEHVIRVVDEAERLADIHQADRQAAKIAALGHDLLRAHSEERLLRIAAEQRYELDPADRVAPILLHGPLAVPILQERYDVMAAEILGAVAYHTTGNEGMTLLQKIVFIADKIEPDKLSRDPRLQAVADFADTDIDAAVLLYLGLYLKRVVDEGWPAHSHTIAARNELLAARAELTPVPKPADTEIAEA